MTNTTTKAAVLTSLMLASSVFADVVKVGQENKLDLSPILTVSQPLPTLAVGKEVGNGVAVGLNGGLDVSLPFISAKASLGSASVGPKGLNVSVGNKNSVNVGPVTVGQNLPTAMVGTSANKTSWFDIRIKNGIGITLPFVNLDVPYPTLAVETKTEAKKK